MKHTCHAHGCETPVPERMFMCRAHWYALRAPLRRAILDEYRIGQEVHKDPSPRYMAVAQRAIAELAFKPHNEEAARTAAPYALASERWRQIAIDKGLGDPLTTLVHTS